MNSKISFLICVLSLLSLGSAHAGGFSLSSEDFTPEGVMPVLYCCDGEGFSPQLSWTDAPADTQAYAITLEDASAKSFQWIVYNIPKDVQQFGDNQKLSKQISVAKNSTNEANYSPPCPPKGALHDYIFTVYALKGKLTIDANSQPEDSIKIIKANASQTATLKVPYPRWY